MLLIIFFLLNIMINYLFLHYAVSQRWSSVEFIHTFFCNLLSLSGSQRGWSPSQLTLGDSKWICCYFNKWFFFLLKKTTTIWLPFSSLLIMRIFWFSRLMWWLTFGLLVRQSKRGHPYPVAKFHWAWMWRSSSALPKMLTYFNYWRTPQAACVEVAEVRHSTGKIK